MHACHSPLGRGRSAEHDGVPSLVGLPRTEKLKDGLTQTVVGVPMDDARVQGGEGRGWRWVSGEEPGLTWEQTQLEPVG